jgi:hypothetical protein
MVGRLFGQFFNKNIWSPWRQPTLSIEIPRENFLSQRSQFLTKQVAKSENSTGRCQFRETLDVTLLSWRVLFQP